MRIEDACFDKAKIQKQNDNEIESYSQTFYALMPFKIREILLVSSFYDAFIVEEEGLISEMVIKEYRHLLLSSPPRITHVISGEEALSKLKKHWYGSFHFWKKNKKNLPRFASYNFSDRYSRSACLSRAH